MGDSLVGNEVKRRRLIGATGTASRQSFRRVRIALVAVPMCGATSAGAGKHEWR
ncbi:hypothetical protein [Polaromonas jejuensis]|uniref:hypothetical protein n=1 Tax=Polaromonas jejuensis TaxID=457502 RepID=UPI000B21FBC8|nr:hypothetical protein [Polaromonas jejuensis]